MATTTIRVDVETRDRLRALAEAEGRTLTEITRDAAAMLERARRIAGARSALDRLRADPEAWGDYLAEAESTHVTDGLD